MKQVNPNSLKNLTLPKQKKDGYGYRYQIPQEKIDELFTCLAQNMTIRDAAKATGVHPVTVRKYFNKGDEKRGIKPLRTRLIVFQERISQKMNVMVEEQRMDRIELVRTLMEQAKKELIKPTKFYDKDGNEIEVYDEKGKLIQSRIFKNITIKDIEKLIKLEAFLCGGSTEVQTKETSVMSAEDISGID